MGSCILATMVWVRRDAKYCKFCRTKFVLLQHISIEFRLMMYFFFCSLKLYGQNVIEVAVKSYWELFRSEIINPFYLFQIFSITLWCLDEYYYYSGCVFFLSGVSIFSSLYETRKVSSKFLLSSPNLLNFFLFSLIPAKPNIAYAHRKSEIGSHTNHSAIGG